MFTHMRCGLVLVKSEGGSFVPFLSTIPISHLPCGQVLICEPSVFSVLRVYALSERNLWVTFIVFITGTFVLCSDFVSIRLTVSLSSTHYTAVRRDRVPIPIYQRIARGRSTLQSEFREPPSNHKQVRRIWVRKGERY